MARDPAQETKLHMIVRLNAVALWLKLVRPDIEPRPLLQRRPPEVLRPGINSEARLEVQPGVAERRIAAELVGGERIEVVGVADRAAVAGARQAWVDVERGDVERAVVVQ